jgi:hypothetical protein
MNELDEIGNKYYRVAANVSEVKPLVWRACGRIARTDTGEFVKGGTTVHDISREKVLAKLHERLRQTIDNLEPPYDWSNPDKVRQLIQKYIAYNRQLTDMYVSLEGDRSKGNLSKESLHKTHHAIRDLMTSETLEIVRTLQQFSGDEKLRLMTSPEKVYSDVMDPWNLDDVYAREALFKFIIDPSDEIIQAHEAHRKRMLQEFEAA